MNIKKMFTTLSAMVVAVSMTLPSASVFGATYSQELQDAYDWAYANGVTTMDSIDNANMYGAITRAQMAKMLSVYATEIQDKTPDTSKACEFTDIDSVKGDLHDYIIESCQLGIMGQGITAFRPYDTISRAEFGTALSRVLYGETYNGGTPYYAKHLDALKADGIMTQIDNPENRDEVRGYVMIMLQRAAEGGAGVDCEDEMVQLACAMESDECPAACREGASDNGDEETDTVVKSGSLVVEADAATGRSAVKGGDSDLDTLTFKTSEEVEITKVVLERYGYSEALDISGVRLENADGKVIADTKTVNSKDQVTLSIKKDYRKVDGSEDWTIVVQLKDNASGSTIGFKVVDVTSTAKDVDLGNYKPYTYDIVTYSAASITLNDKGSNKEYNYEEGEMYEVSKLKIKAAASALEVNGFTLTNGASGDKLDLEDFLDKVEVTVNGEKVSGVKYTVDDDELNISFDSYEIEAKGSATFAVSISLQDYDKYGQQTDFKIVKSSDVKITEKKTGARVSVSLAGINWTNLHKFVGSKIKLSGKKLGSIDASQGSEDVVVLDGEIEIAEAIDKFDFVITGNYKGLSGSNTNEKAPIDEMRLVVAGDEYTASRTNGTFTTTGYSVFTFSNIEIEKSGKFQILIDVDSDATQSATIEFDPSSINNKVFSGSARYSDARSDVAGSEVKGSMSFATKITVQPSKASLENNISKRVEFVQDETSKKIVFDGVYTAKKGDVKLNTVTITGNTTSYDSDITFYVTIDGDEVATLDPREEDTFSDILVKAGESVKVKVEAEISASTGTTTLPTYSLILKGNDENDNEDAGRAEDELVEMRIVSKGTFNITNESTSKNTVLLKASNSTLATFTIKPSNNNDGLTLESIILTGTYKSGYATNNLKAEDIRLKIDGVEYDGSDTLSASGIVYEINEEVPSNGYNAEIILKKEKSKNVTIDVIDINGNKQSKSFNKSFADALVYIDSQVDEKSYTQYTLGVEKYDDSYAVTGVNFYMDYSGSLDTAQCSGTALSNNLDSEVSDGDRFEIDNLQSSTTIKCIEYYVEGTKYTFTNKDYADYFKVDGSAWRVFKDD